MHHSYIDKFSYQNSIIHRLDSRVKVITILIYTALVISLPKTYLTVLTCYLVGPFALLVLGKIPLKFAFKQVLLVSPFILVLALSCPFYDRASLTVPFGPITWQISRGWLRCCVILAKFVITMLALIALVSTTRFSALLHGLQKMGVPKILVIQLGFLYRYIFLFIDKVQHILQARAARKMRNLGFKKETKVAAAMLGSLLIKSINAAENVSIAMQARGFDGHFRTLTKSKIKANDIIFALVAVSLMIFLHFVIRPVMT